MPLGFTAPDFRIPASNLDSRLPLERVVYVQSEW